MSKSKFGTFEMTDEERALYLDCMKHANIANHYENLARLALDDYGERMAKFWDTVKGRKDLPKGNFTLTIEIDNRHITVKKSEPAEQKKFYKPVPEKKVE